LEKDEAFERRVTEITDKLMEDVKRGGSHKDIVGPFNHGIAAHKHIIGADKLQIQID